MGFPDDHDKKLQDDADRLLSFAEDLVDWVLDHGQSRRSAETGRISEEQELKLLKLRNLALNLRRSTKVPAAAAVYGASQTGKSLFVGQVVKPKNDDLSPLGIDDKQGYIKELDFTQDINPQSAQNEATALVTRFSIGNRLPTNRPPTEFGITVRALTRSEWLKVLGRGFLSECKLPADFRWTLESVDTLLQSMSERFGSDTSDRLWRLDLVDAFADIRQLPGRAFDITESEFNSLLSIYPLNAEGFAEFAGRLFWLGEKNPLLTAWFKKVNAFLDDVKQKSCDNSLGVHYAAARFLLDSQHSERHENPKSRWKQCIKLADIELSAQDNWLVIRHDDTSTPRQPMSLEQLKVVQSALIEMTIPVLPQQLTSNWSRVIEKADILDLPGARASGGNYEQIDDEAKVLSVVKRGKVDYLFDRYIDERQIQSLLLLFRGGNQETSGKIKSRIDRWGRNRYSEERWPSRVSLEGLPSLFIGMTGIDEEFKERAVAYNLYSVRLSEMRDVVLLEVMKDFGGQGNAFQNIYPIRYPGTWDANKQRRDLSDDTTRWEKARQAFLETNLVRTHVKDAAARWGAAMDDNDGGLSLISEGLLETTDNLQKQDNLRESLISLEKQLRSLSEQWCVNGDANAVRQQRVELANEVVKWLSDPDEIEERAMAIQSALCFDEGHIIQLSEPIINRSPGKSRRPESVKDRIARELPAFLDQWKTIIAPEQWTDHLKTQKNGALDLATFSRLVHSIDEYLRSETVYEVLLTKIVKVVSLSSDDPMQRAARQELARLILNDFVTNPGPSRGPFGENRVAVNATGKLMDAMVQRWANRLPEALAAGVGQTVVIPAGNEELKKILRENMPS